MKLIGIHVNKRLTPLLTSVILLLGSLLIFTNVVAASPLDDLDYKVSNWTAPDNGARSDKIIPRDADKEKGTETTPFGYSVALRQAESQAVPSVGGQGDDAAIRSSDVLTTYVYLPLMARAQVCQPIPGENYGDFSVNGDPTNPAAEEHPDLNLALLGYEITDAYKGLVDYGGGGDSNAPQLPGLFADNRTATFSAVYQIYGWDWECNCRGALVTDPEVTLAGLVATPGETLHVPDSGYSIGGGYEVLVLYATPERITLKYTPDDHVIWGYTLHLENICVEPSLLALYQSWNEAGRGRLPALRAGQAFGRARGDEIGVVIRDNGAFMDPRSRKDWWQGR